MQQNVWWWRADALNKMYPRESDSSFQLKAMRTPDLPGAQREHDEMQHAAMPSRLEDIGMDELPL